MYRNKSGGSKSWEKPSSKNERIEDRGYWDNGKIVTPRQMKAIAQLRAAGCMCFIPKMKERLRGYCCKNRGCSADTNKNKYHG